MRDKPIKTMACFATMSINNDGSEAYFIGKGL